MRNESFAIAVAFCATLSIQSHSEELIIGDERAVTRHLSLTELQTLDKDQINQHGRMLFDAKFTILDGAGRPAATSAEVPVKRRPGNTPAFFRTAGPDSNACNGCHNQPSSGGAGEFVVNVFSAEGVVNHEFDTLEPQFSNERGTPHLHGSGFVELLAREITADLHNIRHKALADSQEKKKSIKVPLVSKDIKFGTLTVHSDGFIDTSKISGIDPDLIVRPFSQKGVFTSLRQFSINAMNAHHGIQSNERWGVQWTHTNDFDEDGFDSEITSGDLSALVMFQATLPLPVQIFPKQKLLRSAVKEGELLFSQVGCNTCHIKQLPLTSLSFSEPGPYNAAGNLRASDESYQFEFALSKSGLKKDSNGHWLIPVFSDFKRHVIADAEKPHFGNERLSQRFIPNQVFLTARLWGVGSTAPYGHRGDISTLKETILHHGGEARTSRLAFESLTDLEQRKVVEFLKSLQLTKLENSL